MKIAIGDLTNRFATLLIGKSSIIIVCRAGLRAIAKGKSIKKKHVRFQKNQEKLKE